MTSRRRLMQRLAGAAGAVGLAGCSQLSSKELRPELELPPNPLRDELPARQHAMNAALRTDGHGNHIVPRHHTVLLLELTTPPSVDAARTVERAMRTLEATYDWSNDGLFHMLAWGSAYFARLGSLDDAPIRRPQVISRTDNPELQEYDAALVLTSDVPSHLTAAENAMFGRRSELGDALVEDRLGEVFEIAGRRTGFMGEGLPAKHTDAEGIPTDAPISEETPMFMGFRSGRRGTQASEDRVTISSGRFEGGTTMHLSHLRQSLGRWYDGLDDAERVQRMFSANLTPDDVASLTDDVPFDGDVAGNARTYDVVGHHEKVAQVREGGEPLILRRDFNTVDGGRAGVHFLSLQRSLSEFEKTRKAMNGWYVRDDSGQITDRKNNGILNFITVVSRANFYVPPRAARAFPAL